MRKQVISLFCVAILLGACNKRDLYIPVNEEKPNEEIEVYNKFDFSTENSRINLKVNYSNLGGVKAPVYFELYSEAPVEYNYPFSKRDGLKPLYAGYTEVDGSFNSNIAIPSYIHKVYIYSPSFYATTLLEANVENGEIIVSDAENSKVSAARSSRAKVSGDSYMTMSESSVPNEYKGKRWKKWLGDYDRYGFINYKYTPTAGDGIAMPDQNLYAINSRYFTRQMDNAYYAQYDISIKDNAEIVVSFLGANTSWNSSIGYYFYKEGEQPNNLDEANVVMLFPNVQDGQWSYFNFLFLNGNDYKGIERKTAVKLKYFPNIKNNSREGETFIFPKGYRIGFVLATNSWSNRTDFSKFKINTRYRAATLNALNYDNAGRQFSLSRAGYFNYGEKIVVVAFEDYVDYVNFSDAFIAVSTNPVTVFEGPTVVDPDSELTTSEIHKGVYLFEDLWPNKGDYDLNDVIVDYAYSRTFNLNNQTRSESFTLTPYENIAVMENGLGFKVNNLTYRINPSEVKLEIRKKGEKEFTQVENFDYHIAKGEYILTNNVKENMEGEYRVTFVYPSGENDAKSKDYTTQISPFIFRPSTGGKRMEIHICGSSPTSNVDTSFFGKNDDKSDPAQGIYYVRKGNYPFGVYLSGATISDISKLLDSNNEGKVIDLVFPKYKLWVESNGEVNKNWYK